MSTGSILDRSLDLVKVDFAPTHRQPNRMRLLPATLVSTVGSLIADMALVAEAVAAVAEPEIAAAHVEESAAVEQPENGTASQAGAAANTEPAEG